MKLMYTIGKKSRHLLTLSDVKFLDQNQNERELTYWLHDYGKLAYWLKKYGNVDNNILWASLEDVFALENAFEPPPSPKRKTWYKWHIGKLEEIEATQKVGDMQYRLGKFGELAFEAARKSPDWPASMESIIIMHLISKRIENLGIFLRALAQKPIDVTCRKFPKEIDRPKDFRITWNELSTCLKDVYFIYVETPSAVQELVSPNDPLTLSTFILNEIYSTISTLREKMVEKIARIGKTVNPYILADRGSYEIKRALERLNVLQKKFGSWFTSMPDQLLSSIIWYTLVKKGKKSVSPLEFTEILRDDFRFIIDPNDVVDFLINSVEYNATGIDLAVLKNNLSENYSRLLERLVSLGFATIRPDGEVKIEAY